MLLCVLVCVCVSVLYLCVCVWGYVCVCDYFRVLFMANFDVRVRAFVCE